MPELRGKISAKLAKESLLAFRSVAREQALAGDIFPLIRYEWPELIIKDPYELELFAKHCIRKDNLDLRLDDFQVELIRCVFDGKHSQAFMGGGTGLGKGFCVGGIITNLWYSLYSGPIYSKIVMVGPTTDHLIKNMFADTATWRLKMTSHDSDCEFIDDPHVEGMVDKKDRRHTVTLANTSSGEAISGAHSPNTLYIFEEASGIPSEYYTNALSQTKFLIAVSNPRLPSGWFYDGYPKEFTNGIKTIQSSAGPRKILSVGAVDCLNVRAKRLSGMLSPVCGIDIEGVSFDPGEVIPMDMKPLVRPLIPGQICFDRCESLKLTRPPDEVEWAVYGRFPRSNKMLMLFDPDWKAESIKRHSEIKSKILSKALGLDVGGSKTGDPSCLAIGDVQGVKSLTVFREKNLAILKGLVFATAREHGIDLLTGRYPVAIDVIGIGQMMADQMELEGVWVIRVENNGAVIRNKEDYSNRRTEVYGDLAEYLDPKCVAEPLALPDDDMLWEELHAIEKIFQSNGRRFSLIPKRRAPSQQGARITDNRQSIEEKIKRSPDRADAVTLYGQAIRELPEFMSTTTHQFNPSAKLKRYDPFLGTGDLLVTYWSGKTKKVTKEEFVAEFGSESPIPFGTKIF